MKLRKFLILLTVIGAFSACRDDPETHQIKPGGFTGENKSAHQNSPGHSAAGGEQTADHGTVNSEANADHGAANSGKTAVFVDAANREKPVDQGKKGRVGDEGEGHSSSETSPHK